LGRLALFAIAGRVTDGQLLRWFPFAFPFLFVGMWLLISAMLCFMSGWFNLQQWYADNEDEEPLLKLGWQSGSMGLGVNYNSCLTLAARRSGLSVRVWRIFAPFQKPLLIPWVEIQASAKRIFFMRMVRLDFGKPSNGRLTVRARTWARLVEAAKPVLGEGDVAGLNAVPS
jgi:hypothetical protein